MSKSNLKIYFLKAAFTRRGIYILLVAIFIATFLVPKISSFAKNEINTSDFFSQIRHSVGLNFKPDIQTIQIYVTAYSSSIDETDDTPCITASGYDLCKHDKENVVACNFLPFGTKVRFPELNSDKEYTIVDRMHERYNSRMDIWMSSKSKASSFGKKWLTVEIIR